MGNESATSASSRLASSSSPINSPRATATLGADVFDLAERFGIDLSGGQSTAVEADRQAISAHDEALLADYLSRYQTRIGQRSDELNNNALNPQVQEDGTVDADATKNNPDKKVR
jgi:hypothetical protein